jgi:hypothetical protein
MKTDPECMTLAPEVSKLCADIATTAGLSDTHLVQTLIAVNAAIGAIIGAYSFNHGAVIDGINLAHEKIRATATETFVRAEKIRASQKRRQK